MYSAAAIARRRCTATRADGEPCRGWARWDDPEQRCNVHAGRGHYGPQTPGWKFSPPARYPPCTCAAYTFKHRPGGGLCRWPDPPQYQRTTPLGTRGWRSSCRRRIRGGRLVFEAR